MYDRRKSRHTTRNARNRIHDIAWWNRFGGRRNGARFGEAISTAGAKMKPSIYGMIRRKTLGNARIYSSLNVALQLAKAIATTD